MTDPGSQGDAWAQLYDEVTPQVQPDGPEMIALEKLLEGVEDILELGVGTGRFALPLAERGFHVTGIDASVNMLEILRRKDAGQRVTAIEGDFTELPTNRQYDAVLCLYNTINSPLTPEGQQTALNSACRALKPGGTLIVEQMSPLAADLQKGQYTSIAEMSEKRLRISFSAINRAKQLIRVRQLVFSPSGEVLGVLPTETRYIYPSEMSLMAKLAGLDLVDRFGGWDLRPFTQNSPIFLDVYRRS